LALKVGQKVRLKSTGEVGVVVCLWANEHGDIDTYVALVGTEFSIAEPETRPYILRYYATSLEPIAVGVSEVIDT
jgi:hypothetical protein